MPSCPSAPDTDIPLLPPTRLKLLSEGIRNEDGSELNGLLEIRSEMSTLDDSWDVEAVIQFRSYYQQEQWLVKWKGYGEDKNTWEPWENLMDSWVQEQAREVKLKALQTPS